MAAVAGISSPSSMKKKFTVSAGSAGGGASLGVHSARIAGNERIAAGRLARCRSIVLPRASPRNQQSLHAGDLGVVPRLVDGLKVHARQKKRSTPDMCIVFSGGGSEKRTRVASGEFSLAPPAQERLLETRCRRRLATLAYCLHSACLDGR